MKLNEYYQGKKILVTGHKGFKGTWLTQWLVEMGAIVIGVSLPNQVEYSLFDLLNLKLKIHNHEFDIRNYSELINLMTTTSPEIVFHLAAQPIVLNSYLDPHYTHDVNYMGTLNLLESIRLNPFVKTCVIVTSDKVYMPNEESTPLDELSPLGGKDPYSASKTAVEILVNSYRESYFNKLGVRIFTARAGNVIGFGDWGENRLIPDLFRSLISNEILTIRNPNSIRPWQHVNDVVHGYLLLPFKSEQTKNFVLQASYNFGPTNALVTVQDIIHYALDSFTQLKIEFKESELAETKRLILDSSAAKNHLDWELFYSTKEAIIETFYEFNLFLLKSPDLYHLIVNSIRKYLY